MALKRIKTKRKQKMTNKVLAIVGMAGSGKSKVVEIIKEYFDLPSIHFGGVIQSELHKRAIEVNEQNERKVREELRAEYGLKAMAVILEEEIQEKFKDSSVILDGLYSWDEWTYLQEKLGDSLILIAVITPKKVRYSRIATRKIRPLNEKEAKNRDIAEIENLAKGGPIAFADYFLLNDKNFANLEKTTLKLVDELLN